MHMCVYMFMDMYMYRVGPQWPVHAKCTEQVLQGEALT